MNKSYKSNMTYTSYRSYKTYSSNTSYSSYKTHSSNTSYSSYKTNLSYFVLFVLLFSFFPLTKTAEAAVLSRPPSNLGLVGYWPMDEGVGNKVGDASGSGNTGTISGATWTNGKHGKALSFSGANNVITPDITANITPMTVSFWFNASADNAGTGYYVVDLSNGMTVRWGYGLNKMLIYAGAEKYRYTTNVQNPINAWHHFTGVVAGPNVADFHVYVDGKLADGTGGNNTGGFFDSHSNNYIGSYANSTGYFQGVLDDVRIYNRALTATEISKMYSSGTAIRKGVSNNGLVGYWPMNEGRGSKAGDSSGQGNTGTITGATWTNGKRGGALSFDGTSNCINAGSGVSLFPHDSTYSAWIKLSSLPTDGNVGGVIFQNYQGNSKGMFFSVLSSGALHLRPHPSGIVNSTYNLNVGQWYYVTATIEGTVTKLFINGQYNATSSGTYTVPDSGDSGIGCWVGSSVFYFPGIIDEVRIYNRALSASEVQNLYKQSSATIGTSYEDRLTNGLVGNWTFNGKDISGTTVLDKSGQGNNGTITGATKAIGKLGQGLDFKYALNTYVNLGNSASLNPANITISAWVKPRITTGWYNYIYSNARDCCGTYNGYEFYISNTSLVFTVWNGGASYLQLNAGISSNSGWRHLVATYDGAKQKMYINGVLEKSGDYAGGVGSPASYNSYIGAMGHGPGTYSMDGVIDEVRVYNRALAPSEVKQLYDMGK